MRCTYYKITDECVQSPNPTFSKYILKNKIIINTRATYKVTSLFLIEVTSLFLIEVLLLCYTFSLPSNTNRWTINWIQRSATNESNEFDSLPQHLQYVFCVQCLLFSIRFCLFVFTLLGFFLLVCVFFNLCQSMLFYTFIFCPFLSILNPSLFV